MAKTSPLFSFYFYFYHAESAAMFYKPKINWKLYRSKGFYHSNNPINLELIINESTSSKCAWLLCSQLGSFLLNIEIKAQVNRPFTTLEASNLFNSSKAVNSKLYHFTEKKQTYQPLIALKIAWVNKISNKRFQELKLD